MNKRAVLPKGETIREVNSLFPNSRIEPTPEELAFYRSLGKPFAFCIDRQSIPKNATEDGATGMKRRVGAILSLARSLDLHVPEPPLLEKPEPGKLPFVFNEETERFWFVDGTTKRATGYAVSQHARPRLWRAFLLAQSLTEVGCGPKAFLIGEGTRFFRDPSWLEQFVRALWHHGIEFHDGLFGKLDRYNLNGYSSYITAVSGWLGMVGQGARKARRSEHRIFHDQPPFGVVFTPRRDRVLADPVTWPILEELVERLWDGRCRTTIDAASWMGEIGYPRTQAWVVRLLHGPLLEGRYFAYNKKYEARKLKQREGLLFDLDITPGGTRRWLITEQEGDEWEVEHPEGTRPINPVKLRAVRSRLFRGQGRPSKTPPPAGRLIEPRMLRCAACGHAVAETTDTYPNGSPRPWHLTCRAVTNIRSGKACSVETARSLIPEHQRYRVGYASGAIWERLVKGLREAALTGEPEENPVKETHHLQLAVQTAEREFEQYQEWVRAGHEGDMADPHIAALVNKKRAALSKRLTEAHEALELFSSRALNDRRLNASVKEAAEALTWLTEQDLTDDLKREIIQQVVDHVVIDLETGEFTIHVVTSHESLQRLVGRLGGEEKIINGLQTWYNICLRLIGHMPERKAA